MAVKYWHRTGYTGGTDGTLDNIDGALLEDGHIAYVVTSAAFTVHRLNASSGAAESSPAIIAPVSNAGNKRWEMVQAFASRTMATVSKTIGATGDYATHALAMAAVPDLLAHAVTHTIQAGTTLTEDCYIINKHATTSSGSYTLTAEKYYPASGALPTADSATATTLVDSALATAALGDDYFNGCWIFIVDGTGTDNGFVAITDYTDATGTVAVASWPGTQPDATSRYMIVGALIDGAGHSTYIIYLARNTAAVTLRGIGFVNGDTYGVYDILSAYLNFNYCAAYNCDASGYYLIGTRYVDMYYCGAVLNNTDNSVWYAGIDMKDGVNANVVDCGISDNGQRGVWLRSSYAYISNNFGDSNGDWGTYAQDGGIANLSGTECSGTSGDHSNGAGDGSIAY